MKTTDAAWLAGFLDGEGSFMVTRQTRKGLRAPSFEAVIAATNTNEALVLRCRELCGGRIVTTRMKSDRWKDAHIWQLKGFAVTPVLYAVMPFLVGKKEQAKLLMSLRGMTKLGAPSGRFGTRKTPEEVAEREALYLAVKALNARGRLTTAEVCHE